MRKFWMALTLAASLAVGAHLASAYCSVYPKGLGSAVSSGDAPGDCMSGNGPCIWNYCMPSYTWTQGCEAGYCNNWGCYSDCGS